MRLQAEVDAACRGAHAVAAAEPTESTVTVRPGEYAFNSADFNITACVGVTFQVGGGVGGGAAVAGGIASLLFSLGFGVVVRSSRDLVVAGAFAIDYTEEPSSQGTITAVGPDCFSTSTPPKNCTLDVTVHRGFPPPDPAARPDFCPYPACETALVLFSGATGNMLRPQIVNWLHGSARLPAAADGTGQGTGGARAPPPTLATAHHGSDAEPPQHRYRPTTLQMWAHSVAVGDVVAVKSRRCGAHNNAASTGCR